MMTPTGRTNAQAKPWSQPHKGPDYTRVAPLVLLGVTGVLFFLGFWLGSVSLVAGIGGLALSFLLAWRLPVLALSLALTALGAYWIFGSVPGFDPRGLYLGGGVRLTDLLLCGLAVAASIRLLNPASREKMGMLLTAAACFSVWLLLEVLRNYPSVGLSAFGEVRTRYLILILPFFAAVSLRDKRAVKSMLNVFVFIGLVLPIILTPLVLYLNGWALSAKGSIYNAQISLGILLCLLCPVDLPILGSMAQGCRLCLHGAGNLRDSSGRAPVCMGRSDHGDWIFGLTQSRRHLQRPERLVILSLGALLIALLQLYTPLHVWDRVVDQGAAALAVEDTVAWRVAVQKAALGDVRRLSSDRARTWSVLGHLCARIRSCDQVFPHSVYVMVRWCTLESWVLCCSGGWVLRPGEAFARQQPPRALRTGHATLWNCRDSGEPPSWA